MNVILGKTSFILFSSILGEEVFVSVSLYNLISLVNCCQLWIYFWKHSLHWLTSWFFTWINVHSVAKVRNFWCVVEIHILIELSKISMRKTVFHCICYLYGNLTFTISRTCLFPRTPNCKTVAEISQGGSEISIFFICVDLSSSIISLHLQIIYVLCQQINKLRHICFTHRLLWFSEGFTECTAPLCRIIKTRIIIYVLLQTRQKFVALKFFAEK